jgi:hypothetical protein
MPRNSSKTVRVRRDGRDERTRSQERGLGILLLFVTAGLLIFIGMFKGWTISGAPAEYFGYFVGGIGVLGLVGVNIWAVTDLDPRKDPKGEDDSAGK